MTTSFISRPVRFVAALGIAVLCCVGLAGCNETDYTVPSDATSTAPTTATSAPTTTATPAPRTTAPSATDDGFAAFAGDWAGHARRLTINGAGVGSESIGDGCCTRLVDFTFQLSDVRGDADQGTATLTVTDVVLRSGWDPHSTPPQVGQTGTVTLDHGVLTESVIGTNFCAPDADTAGQCGA